MSLPPAPAEPSSEGSPTRLQPEASRQAAIPAAARSSASEKLKSCAYAAGAKMAADMDTHVLAKLNPLIARLDKLTPELAILADQLGLLGLTGAAVTVEGLIDSRGIRALVLNAVTEGE